MIPSLLLLLLSIACISKHDQLCAQAAEEPSSITMGTGAVLFEDIVDGDTLGFHQGPQGGFHVLGSLRAHGIVPGNLDDYADPYNPILDFTVTRDGEPFGGYEELPRPLKVRSDGTLEMVGDYIVLAIGSRDEALGVQVRLDLRLTDACDTVLTDSREVTLVPAE